MEIIILIIRNPLNSLKVDFLNKDMVFFSAILTESTLVCCNFCDVFLV